MHKYNTLLILVVILGLFACTSNKREYSVVFYNVENLFDTINQENVNDDEFTPNGKLKYTNKRYKLKLSNIARVISSIDTTKLPVLVGLCEIENKSVLKDLLIQNAIIDGKYDFVHAESPDFRGIDCALLYQKENFKYLKHDVIPIQFPWSKRQTTRDILYVRGVLSECDTLHLFINHWPSRSGGMEKSERNRIYVAKQLKKAVNKLQENNKEAKIIIMGDLNDEPTNTSIFEILNATNNRLGKNPEELFNLLYDAQKKGCGTYLYRGKWNMLDNLIVSRSLLKQRNGFCTTYTSGQIFAPEYICYKTPNGILAPNRSYAGTRYFGGYSDHFPVFFKLTN